MSYPLVEKRSSSRLGHAVFALDRWLRRRCGNFEYCDDPDCVLRIERCEAPRTLRLRDGTVVRAGEPALRLHLWNEHLPRMARGGPSMRWARRLSRDVERSLCELAEYLARRPDLAGIHVLFGDMNLATARQTRQFRRIVVRLGFEPAPEQPRRSLVHRLGEIILVLLLVIATNPMGLRRALRAHQSRVYLARTVLQRRYGAAARRIRYDAQGRGRPALPRAPH
ncbi:MAG TPA: hypothetical protein VMF64_13140 [Steroidobacteraceae bacterium]|nr:hypothetical protein [Steroidobacteraceae bacterium]